MMEFLIGCVVGGTVGTVATCLCAAAGQSDKQLNHTDSEQ